MGRAEYHAADHKPTQLQVVIDAMNLHAHTCLIMSNQNVFQPTQDFRDMTMIHIFETTLEILRRIAEANSIDVRKCPELAGERLAQQEFALAQVDWLLMLEDMAKRQFTRLAKKPKKVWFWNAKTVELKDRLRAWHESDRKRFSSIAAAPAKQKISPKPQGEGGDGCRLNRSLGGQLPLAVGQSGQLE